MSDLAMVAVVSAYNLRFIRYWDAESRISRRFPGHGLVDAVVCEGGLSLLVQKCSEGGWRAEAEFGAVRGEVGCCAAGGRMEFAGQQHQ